MEKFTVTVFKNIWDTTEPLFCDAIEIFKRIKEGNSKDIIEKIRNSKDNKERADLKKRLPSICFSGRFSKRDAEFLLEHSGLICLDIDKVKSTDLPKIKELISNDFFVYSCFTSPSGNGLKVIVKINADKNNHKSQFLALEQHFNQYVCEYTSEQKNEKKKGDGVVKIDETQGEYLTVHIDKSGKDVNRVCYESYDTELYYNPDSEVWIETLEEVVVEKTIQDQDVIIAMLQKWIDGQEQYYEGNRNNYLSKFLYALCRYGVNEYKARDYISNKFPGVPQKDLEAITKSCYNKNDYNTQSFTELEKSKNTVFKQIKVNDTKPVTEFWSINDKGKVKIDSRQFLKFIAANGFGIYRRAQSDEKWVFVYVNNMIVDIVTVLDIKHHILEYVEKHAPELVYDELQMKNRYFENSFLNALPLVNVEQIKDTIDSSYMFFNDFYYEITKTDKIKHSYIDLQGRHIWRTQIAKKTITEIVDYEKHDFNLFIYRAMGEDKNKYASLVSSIGYLIHTYKKQRLTKLVYCCEGGVEELDDMATGGTGKELAFKCLKYCRAVTPIDGKDFDKKDKFKFQNVSDDTQIVVLNDYKGDIIELFNRITGEFEVEKKVKDKIITEFEDAPKMLVNSNISPKGYSSSYKRRLQLLEFSNHYSADHTPADEFGDKDFFSDDWTQNDFNALYSFLFDCIQYYLQVGLIPMSTDNSENRYKQLVKNTCISFAEHFKEFEEYNEWINGRRLFEFYRTDTMEDISEQKFYSYIRKMCAINGDKFDTKGRGVSKEIIIVKKC